MRDWMMLGAMAFMVPMALMHGFVAFLLWGYTTVLAPANFLYGFMQGFRYNFVFAGIALASLFLGRLPEAGRFRFDRTAVLLLLFFVHTIVSAVVAPDENLLKYGRIEGFSKSMAFVLLMPLFITSRLRLHACLLVIVLGLGLHGVVEGLKFVASGGSHRIAGIGGSSLSDNNLVAVGLAMLLPLFIYFFQQMEGRLARWAALAGLGLTILAVVATNSRGGLIALVVLGLWYVMTTRNKALALLLVLVAAGVVLLLAPDSWFSRINSINTAQEDGSFMNRVLAWKISSAIALANPVFGLGFDAINVSKIWYAYMDAPSLLPFVTTERYTPKVAHSIYFQVMADSGFVGLALFMGVLVSAFISGMEIRREVRKRPQQLRWARDLSDALILALVGYMAGGAGVSLVYYELVYIVVAMLAILKSLVLSEQETSVPRGVQPVRGHMAGGLAVRSVAAPMEAKSLTSDGR